ncbi:hypothetical protein EON65_03880 [archaeon]|nr:MAG: hypothetical protein EON65_03880 [archaeon]
MLQKLYLTKAGAGYSLSFTGRDNQGREFASTSSAEFEVSVGAKYKLSFYNFSGNAFGGEVFADNPVVSVVDRGGNLVNNVNQGVVTISLSQSPTGTEVLRPANLLTVPIRKGLAKFKNLFIKEAGVPYQLQFSCVQVSA